MYQTTDLIADKIISILKEHFASVLTAIDSTLDAPRTAQGGQEDAYHYGSTAGVPMVYPAVRVEIISEQIENLDQSSLTPKSNMTAEIEMLISGDSAPVLTRNAYKYCEAIKEIIYLHNTLDNTVNYCEFQRVEYSNLFSANEGANLFKSFVMGLRIIQI